MMTKRWMIANLLFSVALCIFPARAGTPVADEEFVGPFPSWVNVKTDCGAVGDGKADDTAAIQRGLNELRPGDSMKKVLYFPAGTYRVTGTLRVERAQHFESNGIGLIGENPASTIIRWDGAATNVMVENNAWYSRMERLTLDGAGKAGTAVLHLKPFGTILKYADMVFQDVGFGIEAGRRDPGIAECSVYRCRFVRCGTAGISIQCFNSLDWWIWDCAFEDCRLGVTTEFDAGNYHVYESRFYRSTEADLAIGHTVYFGIRNNISIGSKAFFLGKRPKIWTDKENYGAPATIQGNLILDPQDDTPIRIASAGNTLLLDNVIRSRAETKGGPVVRQETPAGDARMISVGNTFTVPDALAVKGRLMTVDDKVIARDRVKADIPELPLTPPNRNRKVFEVPLLTKAADIQQIINAAAKLRGQRPVVHFQPGRHLLDRTLIIPANCDVQLVGDGIGNNASHLIGSGIGNGPLIRLKGPSRATLRELQLGGGAGCGIVVEQCDQTGGRVWLEDIVVSSVRKGVGLCVDGLEKTDVSGYQTYIHYCQTGIRVYGALDASGKKISPLVKIFSGIFNANTQASFDVLNGGRLLVRDSWYEGDPRCLLCTSGVCDFTLDCSLAGVGRDDGRPSTPEEKAAVTINIDSSAGKVAMINTDIRSRNDIPARFVTGRGDGRVDTLFLGALFERDFSFERNFVVNSGKDSRNRLALINCRAWDKKDPGQISVPDQGTMDPEFLRKMITDTRQARRQRLAPGPAGATDVRFFRISIEGPDKAGIWLSPLENVDLEKIN